MPKEKLYKVAFLSNTHCKHASRVLFIRICLSIHVTIGLRTWITHRLNIITCYSSGQSFEVSYRLDPTYASPFLFSFAGVFVSPPPSAVITLRKWMNEWTIAHTSSHDRETRLIFMYLRGILRTREIHHRLASFLSHVMIIKVQIMGTFAWTLWRSSCKGLWVHSLVTANKHYFWRKYFNSTTFTFTINTFIVWGF